MAADSSRDDWRYGDYDAHGRGDSPRVESQAVAPAVTTARETWALLQASPIAWLALTVAVYRLAYSVYRRTRQSPFANPILISVAIIMLFLFASHTPYPVYFDGARLVHFFIGPATVAMAIPLYNHSRRLKQMVVPLLAAVVIGSITAMLTA